MAKQNFFYTPMSRTEHICGWLLLAARTWLLPPLFSTILLILFPDAGNVTLQLTLFAVNFIAALILFRKFLAASLRDVADRWGSALWKTLLMLAFCKVSGIVMNDFIFFFCPEYFLYTDTGPVLININDMSIAMMAQEQMVLVTLGAVVLAPVVEELLYRGAVFGSLYPKSPLLAGLISTLLFAVLHVLPYINMADKVYLVILFVQYIPPALCLCWLYTATDTILAPILMHILFNVLGALALR